MMHGILDILLLRHLFDTPNLLWSYELTDNPVGAPSVADGKVFFCSGHGGIYCLDENNGQLIGVYEEMGGVVHMKIPPRLRMIKCS